MSCNLSPSTIGILLECPRCFFLHIKKKKKRPRGPFPSLPSGMDIVLKNYFDKYRGSLPPEIKGKVRGVLFEDVKKLRRWRYWKTSLYAARDNITVYGAFDDLLVDGDIYIPLDYKTRGSSPREDTSSYYRHQLDIYTLLLEDNGYRTDSLAYLLYYFPISVHQNGEVKFQPEVEKVETSLKRAESVIDKAKNILEKEEPESSSECEYCKWANQIKKSEGFEQLMLK